MKVTQKFIAATLTDGLTQLEEDNFKWGNTPNENSRLKRAVLNLKDFAVIRIIESSPDANPKLGNRQIAPIIQAFLSPCETIESVENLVKEFGG